MPKRLRVMILYPDPYFRETFVETCRKYGLIGRAVDTVELLQSYLQALETDLVLLHEDFFDDELYYNLYEKHPDLKMTLLDPSFEKWDYMGTEIVIQHILKENTPSESE